MRETRGGYEGFASAADPWVMLGGSKDWRFGSFWIQGLGKTEAGRLGGS